MADTAQPDKLDGESLDLLDQRLAALKALLPEAFDLDGNLVRDKLIEALKPASYEPSDDIPSFGLAWPGKQRAFAAAGVPTTATLRPCPDQSIDFDTTQNLLIEGDNLEVLKTLQRGYHGKVKMIYIDPPYNTGKDFVYPDNYGEGLDTYLQRTQQKDEAGFWKSTNSETSGRKHSNWLSMMTTRLILARNLLSHQGVIFISIDDNEIANLRQLCDEVFGSHNLIAQILWKKRSTPPNDKILGTNHDYILCVAKNAISVKLNLKQRTAEQAARYTNPDNHPKGPWAAGDLMANVKGGRYVESLFYPIVNPVNGKEHYPSNKGNWRFAKEKIDKLIANDEIYFGEDNEGRPKLKRFLADVKDGITYPSIWDFVPLNTKGSSEMGDLFGNTTIFESPKPSGLIQELIQLGSSQEDVILDFFAGSGTTGHAVMAQNAEDGGSRKFICVQLPEPLDEPVKLDDGVVCETIFDLTRERLKRAGKKLKDEAGLNADKLDTGLRVFKLDSSNFTAWNSDPTTSEGELFERLEKLTDHTVPGRSETDILWEMLLKMGLPLDLKLERFELEGAAFIGVADRTRVISTETAIPTAAMEALLAPPEGHIPPSELVVLDSAFADDTARANIATLYKQRTDEDGKPICNLRVV